MSDDVPFAGPYPGLRPFEADESGIFFGRHEQIEQMLQKLETHRFLAVVGSSGCGKSSLVRAGLLPALEDGFLFGAKEKWRMIRMRPGDVPFRRLAEAFSESADSAESHASSSFLEAKLRSGPSGLIEAVEDVQLDSDTNVFLLVDQFEEIFRFQDRESNDETAADAHDQHHRRNEAKAFVNLMLASAAQQKIPVYVVLTMRSDFLGDCDTFRGLPEAINDGQFLTPRLTRSQLRDAVVGPLEVFDATAQPELVNRILNDVGSNTDQLPLMQHALMRIWNRSSGDSQASTELSLDDYNKIGGLDEALSRHADEVYQHEQDAGRGRLVEMIFRSLSERRPDGQEVRRPVTISELARVAEVSTDEVIQVVEQFREPGRSFLMPPKNEPLDPDTKIDVSHESLIRQWDTMRKWIDKEHEAATRYRRLRDTVHLNGSLGGTELVDVMKWRRRDKPTEAWADRYGGEYGACMNVLRKSAIRTLLAASLFLTAVVFATLYFFLSRENEELVEAQKKLVEANKELVATQDELLKAKDFLTYERELLLQVNRELTDKQEEVDRARTDEKAAKLLASIGGGTEYPTPEEFAAYERLSDEPDAVGLSFFKQLLKTPEERYRSQYPFALHAIVGLDLVMRDQVRSELLAAGADRTSADFEPQKNDHALYVSCARLGRLLNIEDDADLDQMIAANFDAALRTAPDPETVADIARRLIQFNGRLTEPQALLVLEIFTDVLTRESAAKMKPEVMEIVKRLREVARVDPEFYATATTLMNALMELRVTVDVDSISTSQYRQKIEEALYSAFSAYVRVAARSATMRTKSGEIEERVSYAVMPIDEEKLARYQSWLSAFAALTSRSSDGKSPSAVLDLDAHVTTAITSLRAALGSDETGQARISALKSLADPVVKTAAEVPDDTAAELAQQIVALMRDTINPVELEFLRETLTALCNSISPGKAAEVAQGIVGIMESVPEQKSPSEYGIVSAYGDALSGICERLPAEYSAVIAEEIIAALGTTTGANFYELAQSLGTIKSLDDKNAESVARDLFLLMQETTDPETLRSLVHGLDGVGDAFPAEEASATVRHIRAAVARSNSFADAVALANVICRLAAKLSDEQAAAAADQVVELMLSNNEVAEQRELAPLLLVLGDKLPVDRAATATKRIIEVMKDVGLNDAASLFRPVADLCRRLPEEQATGFAHQIRELVEEFDSPAMLQIFDDMLSRLGDAHPNVSATQIVALMKSTTDPRSLESLVGRLIHLPTNLSPEQGAAAVESFLKALHNVEDSGQIVELVYVNIGALSQYLSVDQARTVAKKMVTAMERTSSILDLNVLASELGPLGIHLSAEQISAAGDSLIGAAKSGSDLSSQYALREAIRDLSANIQAEHREMLAAKIVEAMKEANDINEVASLGALFSGLHEHFVPGETILEQQSVACARLIHQALLQTSNLNSLTLLTSELSHVATHLPAADVRDAVRHIAAAMELLTDSGDTKPLRDALVALVDSLPPSQTDEPIEAIVHRMKNANHASLQSRTLRDVLVGLRSDLSAEQTCSLLKAVDCVGELRSTILTSTDKDGQSVTRALWAAIDGDKLRNVDLSQVPRYPIGNPPRVNSRLAAAGVMIGD